MYDARAIYEQTLETLFKRVLKGKMTPRLKDELKKAGLDVDHPLPAQYAKARWKRAFDSIAKELFPGVPAHDAHVLLGRTLVDEYRKSAVGMAVGGLARMLGPRRVLERAQQMLEVTGNTARTELEQRGPAKFELWMKQPAVSNGFTEGLLSAGLTAAGASGVRVSQLKGSVKNGFTFGLQWDD